MLKFGAYLQFRYPWRHRSIALARRSLSALLNSVHSHSYGHYSDSRRTRQNSVNPTAVSRQSIESLEDRLPRYLCSVIHISRADFVCRTEQAPSEIRSIVYYLTNVFQDYVTMNTSSPYSFTAISQFSHDITP